MIQSIINALKEHMVKELQRHAALEISHHVSEYLTGHKYKVVHSVMTSFLEAIGARRYDDALALCTPELDQVLRKDGGIAAHFDYLFTLMNGRDDLYYESPTVKLEDSVCQLNGRAVRSGAPPAPYTITAVKAGGNWRINAYDFHAIPPPAPAPINHDGVPPGPGGAPPAGYPIKGSRTSVYHVPGGRYYESTTPVRCFATAADAKAAGFWPSKRG